MIDSGKNLQRLSKIFAFTKNLFEVIIFIVSDYAHEYH